MTNETENEKRGLLSFSGEVYELLDFLDYVMANQLPEEENKN